LEFLLVLFVNFGPQHDARGFAEKGPVALCGVRHASADGGESVFDFGREKKTMLISDRGGIALQMDVNPAALFETICALEARIIGGGALPIGGESGLLIVLRVLSVVGGAAGDPQQPGAEQQHAESDNA